MKDLIERLEASSDEVESHPHPSHCEHLHVAFKVMREAAAELRALTATAPANQNDPDYVPGALDRTAPERVWLQIDPAGNNEDRADEWPKVPDGVSWCWHSIGGLEIQYVRADLVTKKDADIQVLRAEMDGLKLRLEDVGKVTRHEMTHAERMAEVLRELIALPEAVQQLRHLDRGIGIATEQAAWLRARALLGNQEVGRE